MLGHIILSKYLIREGVVLISLLEEVFVRVVEGSKEGVDTTGDVLIDEKE